MKRNGWKGILTAGAVAAGVLASSVPIAAATDMFMKIGNITGESTDKVHKGEIDVLAWSWGASPGTAKTKKGLQPPACIQDLSFTKRIDTATPDIILNAVSGAPVPTARLTVRRGGDTPIEFLRLDMTNVTVAAYQTGGSGGETYLTENVTLHFDTMSGVYRQQNLDGTPGAEIPFQVSGACPQ